MMNRAILVWILMLVVASANGAFREGILIPRLGDLAGRGVSTVLLSAAVLVLTFLTIRWIAPLSYADAWVIGALWVTLTLAFEFLAGHFLFGNPWNQLLEDYNVMRGRIWLLVLLTIVVSPRLCAAARGLMSSR